MKCVKELTSKDKGKNVDEKLMLSSPELLGIDCNHLSPEELEAMFKKSSNRIEGAQKECNRTKGRVIIGSMPNIVYRRF